MNDDRVDGVARNGVGRRFRHDSARHDNDVPDVERRQRHGGSDGSGTVGGEHDCVHARPRKAPAAVAQVHRTHEQALVHDARHEPMKAVSVNLGSAVSVGEHDVVTMTPPAGSLGLLRADSTSV